ncbi:peptide deformylase [Shewanella sp. 1_MG-2023]|uniref:peptide deformylase n=1 Tax=unclassified Shewanella TaxID=196818 RepID=UPI0026E2A825|nr:MULTISPECIES: peptide deformylase [unclassified Shewanella]MDO6611493.1 peptide deformylase [Shewanella sp. 7_MG-2023]MDO6771348.1 peptide deformylase [Shewanella sp. 2_MG-2023]MDO6793574.1 peptide deformylase [Shewanella sp. 1_MG-2023]
MPASDIMTIAQSGEAILNRQAQAVISFDPALVQLTENMIATMTAANGVGIAAPQVFSDLAVFIMHSRSNDRYPNAPETSATVVINPRIIAYSDEMELGSEGCLSIAERRVDVLRHKTINVQYQSLSGEVIKQQLSDFVARIFQHEFDHLQGITLLERITMADQTASQAGNQEISTEQNQQNQHTQGAVE